MEEASPINVVNCSLATVCLCHILDPEWQLLLMLIFQQQGTFRQAVADTKLTCHKKVFQQDAYRRMCFSSHLVSAPTRGCPQVKVSSQGREAGGPRSNGHMVTPLPEQRHN